MIKLENSGALPQARALLVIEARGEMPSVSLACEDVKEEIGGQWVVSSANVRQVVSCFIDGKPFKLSGKIAAAYAVECSACAKVLVEVEVKLSLSAAFEKGDKSREVCQLQLVRVVEVWKSAKEKLWAASQPDNGHAASATMDLASGRIAKAQPVGGRS